MSQLYVDNIRNRTGGAIGIPTGAVVTGVITATTGNITGNLTVSGDATVGGALTYEDVINVDSVGVITARSGVKITGGELTLVGTAFTVSQAGVVSATSFIGDGSNLEGVVSGIEVEDDGTSVGTSLTALNFSGATVVGDTTAGIATITIAAAGISTTKYSPAANAVIEVGLGTAQHHELTLTAGITTISCTGGTYGESHSLVLNQPSTGIATVGFSTYFLFPSGATPSMSEGSSKVDLVSFVVKTQGSTGIATELLASAGLNYQ